MDNYVYSIVNLVLNKPILATSLWSWDGGSLESDILPQRPNLIFGQSCRYAQVWLFIIVIHQIYLVQKYWFKVRDKDSLCSSNFIPEFEQSFTYLNWFGKTKMLVCLYLTDRLFKVSIRDTRAMYEGHIVKRNENIPILLEKIVILDCIGVTDQK